MQQTVCERLKSDDIDFFESLEVEITCSKMGEYQERKPPPCTEVLTLKPKEYEAVALRVNKAASATQQCEQVIDWLMEVALDPSAFTDKPCLTLAAQYLEAVIEVSGEPFMHSWNHEKISAIGAILRKWARGTHSNAGDQDYVYANLSSFNPPTAWVGRPPEVSNTVEQHSLAYWNQMRDSA